MLQPKKTKFRRAQKGRMKGIAQRGNSLAFGSFGIDSSFHIGIAFNWSPNGLPAVRSRQRVSR